MPNALNVPPMVKLLINRPVKCCSTYYCLNIKQECIPVGCVPSAAVAVSPAMHTPLPCMPPRHARPPAPPPPVDRILDTRL